MKISSNTWHYKVFDWWFAQMHNGWTYERFNDSMYNQRPYNLCPYVRAVILWAPLVFLFTLPRLWYTIGGVIAAFNAFLYHKFGMHGLRIEGQVILFFVSLATFIASLFGIAFLLKYLINTYREYKNLKPPVAEASFFVILGKYLKSKHDRICPPVTFSKE